MVRGFGRVYNICDASGNCNYACKIQEISPDITQKIENEIEQQNKAAELGVAPRIFQVMFSTNTSLIIMEKLSYTLQGKIKHLLNSPIDSKDKLRELLQILKEVKNLVFTLYSHDIIHNDLHTDNVMFNERLNKFQVIDFGMSRKGIRTFPLLRKRSRIENQNWIDNDMERFLDSFSSTVYYSKANLFPNYIECRQFFENALQKM